MIKRTSSSKIKIARIQSIDCKWEVAFLMISETTTPAIKANIGGT